MSIIRSLSHAVTGLVNATRKERNLKIHFIAMAGVILAGLAVRLSKTEWIICIMLFGLVIGAELFNTAIEKTLDYVNRNYSDEIKFIKDTSAASVLVLAVSSALIGLMIFLSKLP